MRRDQGRNTVRWVFYIGHSGGRVGGGLRWGPGRPGRCRSWLLHSCTGVGKGKGHIATGDATQRQDPWWGGGGGKGSPAQLPAGLTPWKQGMCFPAGNWQVQGTEPTELEGVWGLANDFKLLISDLGKSSFIWEPGVKLESGGWKVSVRCDHPDGGQGRGPARCRFDLRLSQPYP